MATIEQLYKDFGVLADAKDKAGEVSFAAKVIETESVFFSPLCLFISPLD